MPVRKPRRIDYPDQDEYPGAFVVLPAEWLGEHFMRRDQAVDAAAPYKNVQIAWACVALCLVDDWGGIPGLEGSDPAGWNFKKVPAPLLVWLEQTVVVDFAKVYVVPKDSAVLSSSGSTATAQVSTAGG